MVMPWNHQPLDEAIGDGHHGDVFWDDGEFVAIRGHRGDDDGGVARTSSGIPGRLQGWVCGVLVMPWRFCGSLIVWFRHETWWNIGIEATWGIHGDSGIKNWRETGIHGDLGMKHGGKMGISGGLW